MCHKYNHPSRQREGTAATRACHPLLLLRISNHWQQIYSRLLCLWWLLWYEWSLCSIAIPKVPPNCSTRPWWYYEEANTSHTTRLATTHIPKQSYNGAHRSATEQTHNYAERNTSVITVHVWYSTATVSNYTLWEYKWLHRWISFIHSSTVYYTKKHPSHDNYLYRQWNNPTTRSTTKKTQKTNQRILTRSTTKDDPSVTSTLETFSTLDLDTRSSYPTYIDTDAILSITIWNQPIAQYRIPIQPSAYTRNRSREHHSTAVWYALIGVYNKLIHPPKSPCLLFTLTSIICVVLSCFLSLAASFTLVKIDDQYPDEWFDYYTQ